MIDIYLRAPTRQALVADLAPLELGAGGELAAVSHRHALAMVSDDKNGVTVVVRCLDEALAVAVALARFAKTSIIPRPDGALLFAGSTEADLAAIKAAACAAIDAEAERRRMLVMTPGEGQALEYQHTAEEAARAVASPDPLDAAAYPFLAAEQEALFSTIGAVSLRDVAEAVLTDRVNWLAYGAAIKTTRRRAKLEIGVATDAVQVAAVVAGTTWPTAPGA